jgi:hypothetical protein
LSGACAEGLATKLELLPFPDAIYKWNDAGSEWTASTASTEPSATGERAQFVPAATIRRPQAVSR